MAKRSNELEKAIAAIPVRTCSTKRCRRQATLWASVRYGETSFRGSLCESCWVRLDKEVWQPAEARAAYEHWAAMKAKEAAA